MKRRLLKETGAQDIELIGMPVNEDELRALKPFEFQNWVMQRLNGTHSARKSGDMGIDGFSFMSHDPIQVKQSERIGRNVVDNFETALERAGRTPATSSASVSPGVLSRRSHGRRPKARQRFTLSRSPALSVSRMSPMFKAGISCPCSRPSQRAFWISRCMTAEARMRDHRQKNYLRAPLASPEALRSLPETICDPRLPPPSPGSSPASYGSERSCSA